MNEWLQALEKAAELLLMDDTPLGRPTLENPDDSIIPYEGVDPAKAIKASRLQEYSSRIQQGLPIGK